MAIAEQTSIIDAVREASQPLGGNARDYDPLLKLIGNAHFCLLGEATHGTHDFYRERAEITKRLIKEKGFTAIAVEADWPDAFRVNRYVRGLSDDRNADEALSGFKRFPTWMWRNTVVLDFVEWRRMNSFSLNRMHAWCLTPKNTTARCFAGASSPGIFVIDIWPRPSMLWSST